MTDADRFVERLQNLTDYLTATFGAGLVQVAGIVTISFPDGTRADFTAPTAHNDTPKED